jgi:hypothetical protein
MIARSDDGAVRISDSRYQGGDALPPIILDGVFFRTDDFVDPYHHTGCSFIRPTEALPNDERLLFHYTSTHASLSVLREKVLNISSFASANDDFERAPWLYNVYGDAVKMPVDTAQEISRELSGRLKQAAKFTSFSRNANDGSGNGALSLQEGDGWKHPGMWAHYGRRFEKCATGQIDGGAVLVFHTGGLLTAARHAMPEAALLFGDVKYLPDNEPLEFAVAYDQYRAIGPDSLAGLQLQADWMKLYFTKYEGWSYEREARLVVSQSAPQIGGIPISEAVRALLLGDGASAVSFQEAERLTKELSIDLYRVRWRNGLPVLVPAALA